MGWITRRIAGFVTFAIVSAVLGAWAFNAGYITGEPTLSTTRGVLILGVAFLVSLALTHRMKVKEKTQKAWDEYNRAWQEYYARAYPGEGRKP